MRCMMKGEFRSKIVKFIKDHSNLPFRFAYYYYTMTFISYTSLGSTTNTHRNPCLLTGSGGYLPAYELKDESLERCGRDGNGNGNGVVQVQGKTGEIGEMIDSGSERRRRVGLDETGDDNRGESDGLRTTT